MGLSERQRLAIAGQVAANPDYQADGLRPDEVDVRDDGDILIDRRGDKPWAVPFVVGRWSS